MGNSNPKEFFDFDYRKVSNPVTNPENSHKMTIILKANKFYGKSHFLRARCQNAGKSWGNNVTEPDFWAHAKNFLLDPKKRKKCPKFAYFYRKKPIFRHKKTKSLCNVIF